MKTRIFIIIFNVFLLIGCNTLVNSNTVNLNDDPMATIFEGTWTSGDIGFSFSGTSVTQFSNSGEIFSNKGVFTFTDTTITFQMSFIEWTMGYVMTGNRFELIRLPGDNNNWSGFFIKDIVNDLSPTIFEGTWKNGDIGFSFSGTSVTQFSNSGEIFSINGTFTFTDTTITFKMSFREWTMRYTLNNNQLNLIRLPDDNENWTGRFTRE